MPAERLATGEVVITLRDEQVIAGLDRVRAKYAFTMDEINRQSAKLRIDLDTSKAQADLKKFLEEKRALQKRAEFQESTISQGGGATKLSKTLSELEKVNDAARKAANEDYNLKTRSANLFQSQLNAQQNLREANVKASEKQYQIERRSALEEAKALREKIDLQDKYAKATDKVEKAERQRPGLFNKEAKVKVKLETARAQAEFDIYREELKLKGIEVPAHVQIDRRRTTEVLRGALGSAAEPLKSFAGGGFRVPLPFSTLRAPVGALAAGAPLIASALGGITSLAGAAGAGALGAGAIGGGLLGGLAGNFLGIAAAIKPLTGELSILNAAYVKVEKAVKQYGAGSKQAVTAQAELNEVIRRTPKVMVQAENLFHQSKETWLKDTQGIRNALSNMLLDIGKAEKKLLPVFARNSTKTADIISSQFGRFTKGLTSPRELAGLDSLGKSANEFLKPALVGLEAFTKGLLHIGESAAKIFGGEFGKWLEKVGVDFGRATQPGEKLNGIITTLGDDAKGVGKFFIALGKIIFDALGLAAPRGVEFTDSITHSLERWDSKMTSVEGKKGFKKFIDESDKALEQLGPLLQSVVKLLGSWAIGLIPAINVVLEFANGVTHVVNWLGKLIGLGSGVKTLGALLGGLFIASKALAFASALNKVYETLKLMRGLQLQGDIVGALKVPFSGNVAKAAEKGVAGEVVKGAEGGAGFAAASRLAPLLAPAAPVLAVAATAALVGFAASKLGLGGKQANTEGEVKEGRKHIKELRDSYKELTPAIAETSSALEEFHGSLRGAKEALAHAKPGTEEWKEALHRLHEVQTKVYETQKKLNEQQDQAAAKSKEQTKESEQNLQRALEEFQKFQSALESDERTNDSGTPQARELTEKAKRNAEVAERAVQNNRALEKAVPFDTARAKEALPSLGNKEDLALGRLAGKSSKAAGIVSVKYLLPSDVSEVSNKAREAIEKGVKPSTVIKVLASTKDAKSAIDKLGKDMEDSIRTAMKNVQKEMHNGAGRSVQAFSEGFGHVASVTKSVFAGVETELKKVFGNIVTLTLKELKALNGGKLPPSLSHGGPPLAPPLEAQRQAEEHAQGGLVQYGRPGDKGHDKIAAQMVVGSGEIGAVFTGHQQKVANDYLAPIGGLPGLFRSVNKPHYQMAHGGIIRGPVSTFGPPLEGAGPTAYGGSDNRPGIAVNPHGGSNWNDALARSFAGLVAKVTVAGHSANLKVIDKGPSAIGSHGPRVIDITGRGVEAMGMSPAGFPTDAIGTADFGGGNLIASTSGLGGVAGGGHAHSFKPIPKQRINLHGLLGAVVTAGVEKVRHAANKQLAKFASSLGGEGGGELGSSGPGGLGKFDGLPVANWIIPELNYARSHGWTGHITSGYRSPSQVISGPVVAPQGQSEHQGTRYPHGAVDFGGPFEGANRVAFEQATVGYRGKRLLKAQGFTDEGHMSASGHARGGLIKRPALLVGEHEDEWVINPKRADNHMYLKQAGEEMGYHVTPAAKGKHPVVKKFKVTPVPSAEFAGARAIPASLVTDPLHEAEKVLKAEETKYAAVQNKLDKEFEKLKKSKSASQRAIAEAGLSGDEAVRKAKESQALAESHSAQQQQKATQYYVEPGRPNPAKETADKSLANARTRGGVRVANAEHSRNLKLHKAQQSAKIKDAEIAKQVKHLEEGLRIIKGGHKAGHKGVWEHQEYIGWDKLKKDISVGTKVAAKLEEAENKVTGLNKAVKDENRDLGVLFSHWTKATKGKNYKEAEQIEGQWNSKFGEKKKNIEALTGLLKHSESEALKFNKQHPSAALKAFIESFAPEKENLETEEDKISSEEETSPGTTRKTEEENQSAAGFLEAHGRADGLKAVEEKFALAEARFVPDNPNTTTNEELPGLRDELGPAKEIQSLWEGALSEAQAIPGTPVSTITEIAHDVASARSTAIGLEHSIESAQKATASQVLAENKEIGSQRYELFKNFGSNFAPVLTSLASAGTINSKSPSQGNTVNYSVQNHFTQPPPNPHHWATGVAFELGAVI